MHFLCNADVRYSTSNEKKKKPIRSKFPQFLSSGVIFDTHAAVADCASWSSPSCKNSLSCKSFAKEKGSKFCQ